MITIDKRKMLSLLKGAVRKKGGLHVESACRYTQRYQTAPACIVGTALYDLDPTLFPLLRKIDNKGVPGVFSSAVADNVLPYLENYGYHFTEGAVKAARAAQIEQDTLGNWGDALLAAKMS